MGRLAPSLVGTASEAILCGVVFVAAMTYTLVTCTRMVTTAIPGVPMVAVFGFPDWVFWGIVVPWGVCTVISAAVQLAIMQDHDFEEAAALRPWGRR